mmetsp:Transcript_1085/g.1368  ORF Transcript_1085/g.1368 Transcript_1085/m.1368 type:complete len:113 (-) Transcript_1085:1568-1906(-)
MASLLTKGGIVVQKISQQTPQKRQLWQEVVRTRVDQTTGKATYEQPLKTIMRATRGMGNDDAKRQAKQVNYTRYEKPWMKKQRKQGERVYRRKKTQVQELTKYVHFLRDQSK